MHLRLTESARPEYAIASYHPSSLMKIAAWESATQYGRCLALP